MKEHGFIIFAFENKHFRSVSSILYLQGSGHIPASVCCCPDAYTFISVLQVQTKLLELKELENNQFSWHSQPHNTLVNGTADHSSLSNSSSETANLNENAERESIAEDEQTHSVSPVSSVLTAYS